MSICNSKKFQLAFRLLLFSSVLAYTVYAQDRFPKPEFESGYQLPATQTPQPRSLVYEYLDVGVLILTIALASYFALKKRSRKAISGLTIFSLIYFGFIREGCICAVGSIQNMTLALFDPAYVIPVTVVAFFALPLVFTLFFGRTFCAAACPLGALQDVVAVQPKKVPFWLSQVLGILPYIYLGLSVLFAATGSAFIICRYDPFVGFFRMNASFGMIVFSVAMVILGIFIARPYCRFLCPYGVLLSWMARFSRWRITITPDTCVDCRLCEDACPVGAIQKPTPEKAPEPRKKGIKRLAILVSLLPFIMLTGGWSISEMQHVLARVHPSVRLTEQIMKENTGVVNETTLESRTFRSTGTPSTELFEKTMMIKKQNHTGGWILGAFLGLVVILKLIKLSIRRTRTDYEPDPAQCLSCGRCFDYCVQENVRKKNKA